MTRYQQDICYQFKAKTGIMCEVKNVIYMKFPAYEMSYI